MAFARSAINAPLSTMHAVAAIVGTLVLAFGTWRFVERPFRGDDPVIKRPVVFISLAVGVSSVLIVLGSIAAKNDGHVNRFAVNMEVIETMDRPVRSPECF